jgi:uncharacterized phage protein (TIGR01671 family)
MRDYRAWDINDLTMYKPEEIINISFVDERILVRRNGIEFTVDFSEIILTQHTGFKDKNGIEVYDGDFLRIVTAVGLKEDEEGNLLEDENGRCIDVFKEEIVSISYSEADYYELKAFKSNGVKWDNGESYEDWRDEFYRLDEPEYFEVIGNICENPELRESTQ